MTARLATIACLGVGEWLMCVLTADDFDFWQENGFVILHDAAPRDNLQAVIDAIWAFQEMNPDDPGTWYRKPERLNGMPELNGSGMVEMYHHPSLWANRQLPRIHGAFADIWGTEKLWVTIDRANLNVPNRPGFEFRGFIHWDIDTSLEPLPFDVQGVLSLTDTVPGQGGFQDHGAGHGWRLQLDLEITSAIESRAALRRSADDDLQAFRPGCLEHS